MPTTDYLNQDSIFFLNAETRDQVLKELSHHAFLVGKVKDESAFLHALMEREKIVSTGIGMGVAIPHAKLPTYDKFFIVLGILQKPVEWDALDTAPVRIVFMIGGPDDKQTEYLQLLSSLTFTIKNEEKRKKLLTLTDPQSILALFKKM